MDTNAWLLIAVFVLGIVSLGGFFWTKTKGFGRYATSVLLFVLALIISALFFTAGRLDGQFMPTSCSPSLFAGGLFTGKEQSTESGR